MRYATYDIAGFHVDVWEDAAPPSPTGQDAWLVAGRAGGLRLAAIDGCSLSRPGPNGLDGGVWAATVVRATLLADGDTRDALGRANRALHDPAATCARDLPQACVVAADIRAGRLDVVRAGDCEAWVRRAGCWQRLFSREIRTAASLGRFRQWETDHADATADERYDAEVVVWAAAETWYTAALGRFAEERLQEQRPDAFDEVVLATDGAHLTAEGLDTLERWLDGLRNRERSTPAPRAGAKTHDDLVVLRARPL